ncbi:phosphatase PAP2 family protein [Uliginosibacterium aquaticum]|uniref:Phosphatase PAP2 family protein n=1 Tax=Uliginosibacterium aquaticum TaxID=2731212 RepID=A0ABX2IEF5_9RHOO|nr:phosphatase PAP2 family protein [Uliginosibacterium aquaticum]NSL54178.1 phosphatase PAP2 family protein [Uliginosibacterium aquaticum]
MHQLGWGQRFWQTLRRCFWFKSLGTMGFTFVFFLAYIYLLKNPADVTFIMPRIWLDSWISFHPLALIPYLSLWAYVSLPPIFMLRHVDIVAYGVRIGLLCIVGLVSFYLWPTAVPPADIDWARYPGMAFLKGVDAAGNACPSLHVATAVFSAIWLDRLLRDFGSPAWLRWASALWCVAIVWSTVATRQHVALDALAGIALAGVAAWLSMLPQRPFPLLTGPVRREP